MKDILKRGMIAHSKALARGEYSSEELVRAYLERIDECDKDINAFISVMAEKAIIDARRSDKRRSAGEALSELDGIPIAIKDNICLKGSLTTCASKMLERYLSPYNATVVDKLEHAGFVILGKTNMDEFAMGSSGENSAYGATKNPKDLTRVAGGSSSGSAASVAAYEAPCALGSDTGGSVRQPAAFCGNVGMKPTYGLVSRYGLVAFAPSFDQIGPITRDIRDNARLLSVICGKDKHDATSIDNMCQDFSSEIGKEIKKIKIALPKELFSSAVTRDVRGAVLTAAERYTEMGAEVREISIPSLEYALAAYYVISSAEASSNLARFDGVRFGHRSSCYSNIDELYIRSRSEGFGAEVKRRIMLGTFALSEGYYDEYYKQALRVRRLVIRELTEAFEKYDVLLSPTVPTVAYGRGEKINDPTEMYAGDICCVPANIAGIPALSLPCGIGEGGMPIGMQLTGRSFSESLLYRVGAAFEGTEVKRYES